MKPNKHKSKLSKRHRRTTRKRLEAEHKRVVSSWLGPTYGYSHPLKHSPACWSFSLNEDEHKVLGIFRPGRWQERRAMTLSMKSDSAIQRRGMVFRLGS